MISPSPCRKSVSTLVCALLEGQHLAAGVRRPDPLVAIGWPRPTRASSARCHISLTGLPIALEISAASSAPSKNSRRPNEPPPCMTCTVTWSGVSPSCLGDPLLGGDRRLQAGPDLGPVGAHVGDRGVGVQRGVAAEVEHEVVPRPSRRAGCPAAARQRQLGGLAARRAMSSSDSPATGPAFQSTSQRADRVDALAEGLGAHRDAGVDDRDVA